MKLKLKYHILLVNTFSDMYSTFNRYHIHEYNIDGIMGLILPYHETNLFARMVQILPLNNETDRWFWLKSVQKKSISLSKTNLLTRASSDSSFFKFVCNLPLQAIQVI